ncbi:MAG TPA: multidrug ABC transporter ATP-binding protein [Lentisphaeria bacterium]|nr:MAG: hypothetical protein A2X45_23350 [Lentisphaerae bacterium GWF2_50_93]HCE42596.1 multidrug ABC transporter ATP-binding protein [Lentisphaeria bacterium]
MNVIETKELTKFYGSLFWKKKEPALDKLTIEIPEGSVFGFLGPNGAGKTTTIRLLMDLIKPSSGEALLFGQPPDNLEMKRVLGFLPDNPVFSTYLTAYEFLDICAKLLRIPSTERKKRIEEVVDTVKMSKHLFSKLGGFSRGMTQRIGIAQAILNKPKLLILDEPLVGLDPHGRQELKDIILAQKNRGTNVFFSSHILSDVEKMCDRISILYQGNLLCYGKLEDLLSETGSRVHVKHGEDEIIKDLLPEATGTIRLSDGSWELVFQNKPELSKRLKSMAEQNPKALTITPSRENLEDFFFRKIENAQQII